MSCRDKQQLDLSWTEYGSGECMLNTLYRGSHIKKTANNQQPEAAFFMHGIGQVFRRIHSEFRRPFSGPPIPLKVQVKIQRIIAEIGVHPLVVYQIAPDRF